MAFKLPDLPYSKDALAPIMSAETLEFHHGKHHKAYVDKANQLLQDKGLSPATLVEAIRHAKQAGDTPLYNQTAQIWNHSFFWQCLAPAGQQPSGELAQSIERDFGSTEALLKKFKEEALAHFSNGWAWLVLDGDRLKVTSLHDADTPVAYEGMKPLLTVDVWEHAYYIDYRNVRADFLDKVLQNIINWDFVAQNLDGNGESRADQRSEARELTDA